MQAPTIHFNEFSNFTATSGDCHDFQVFERTHPEFGTWREKSLDLGHIRVHEHRADLTREINVRFDDGSVDEYVHHCMTVEGAMGANFTDYNISANLTPQSFHNLFLPADEYYLTMEQQFVNVHIEVKREYYMSLLCDSERWSAELKQKLADRGVYYPGEFRLSQQMLQTIHTIFNSSMSGALKKLLIEAKVHELVALQLHHCLTSLTPKAPRNNRDLFCSIKEYLDQTFLCEHSLQGICRHFAINEFTLKRGFRDHFDTTVFDYILSKRLDYSYKLLRDSEKTVQQIGSEVGYKYPNHFSAAFKKRFGINPTELRR